MENQQPDAPALTPMERIQAVIRQFNRNELRMAHVTLQERGIWSTATMLLPGYSTMATVDGDWLTRLVFLAHDYGVRVSISPCNMQYTRLHFCCRSRDGSTMDGHPTLEQKVASWRNANPVNDLVPPDFTLP